MYHQPRYAIAATVRLADFLVVRGFSPRAVSQAVLQAGVPELIDGTCLPEDTTLVGIGQEAREGPVRGRSG
jgi:hypothetical protein